MKIDLILALLAFVGGAVLWVASTDASVGNGEVVQYCEMRQVWTDTDGSYGWPEGTGGLDDEVCYDQP